MIAIIDYDAGNLKSVQKALDFLHQECVITRDFHEIRQADKVILPGVGSFGEAMVQLKKYELDKVIQEVAEEKKPFLGICLGLQLLFEGSEESSGVEGLHLLDGQILRIPDTEGLKIPHIGWNSLDLWNNGRLFAGLPEHPYVYFVHSYYLKAKDDRIVKATTEYGTHIHASVEQDNIFACQFHPEKSSDLGLAILKNFAENGIRSQIIDMVPTRPEMEFPRALEMKRHFILHVGPTNCGKTYQALQRLRTAYKGIYLGPLRLLALEVYEKMRESGVPCTMLTGEERIYEENSRVISSTVEMLDIDQVYDVAVIDEAQMIADSDRGHSWTRGILGIPQL